MDQRQRLEAQLAPAHQPDQATSLSQPKGVQSGIQPPGVGQLDSSEGGSSSSSNGSSEDHAVNGAAGQQAAEAAVSGNDSYEVRPVRVQRVGK